MANRYEIEDLVQESYGETLDSYAYYLSGSRGILPGSDAGLLRRAYPVDHFVRADYYVSGCPPNIELLGQLVLEITGEPQDKKPAKSVCAECGRKPVDNGVESISFMPPERDEPGICFLSQGVVCMGSQTQGGCNAACTVGGMPCWGCRGPAGSVLGRLHKGDTIQDVFFGVVKARSRLDESAVKPMLRILRTRANNALTFQPNLGNERSRVR
jgi:F420-non-reducing hydrogenase small subunit